MSGALRRDLAFIRRLAQAVPAPAGVSALAIATLGLNFLTQTLAAALLGAGHDTDAYFAALTLPTVITGIVTSAMTATLIPQFTKLLNAEQEDEAWTTASGILNLSLVAFGLALLSGIVFSRALLEATVGGLPTATLELATQLVPLVWSGVLGAGAAVLIGAIQQARKRFLWAALAPALGAATTLGLAAFLVPSWRAFGLAAATVAGSAVQLGFVVPGAFASRSYRFTFGLKLESVRRTLALSLPLVTLGALYQSIVIVDRYLAAMLAPGAITYLAFARKIVTVLVTMVGSGLANVAFVTMAEDSAKGDLVRLRKTVATNARLLWMLILPLVTILGATRLGVVTLLFQHGRFTAADSQALASILPLFLVAMVGMAFGNIIGGAFYALQDTRTTSVMGVVDVVAYVVYMPWLARTWGVMGISAGIAFYYSASLTAICVALWLKLQRPRLSHSAQALGRVLACGLGAGAIAELVVHILGASPILGLVVGGSAGGAVYVLLLTATRSEELLMCRSSLERALGRLSTRLPQAESA